MPELFRLLKLVLIRQPIERGDDHLHQEFVTIRRNLKAKTLKLNRLMEQKVKKVNKDMHIHH
jgi:hypothetical protein